MAQSTCRARPLSDRGGISRDGKGPEPRSGRREPPSAERGSAAWRADCFSGMALFRRILVPHDFSTHADHALRVAADLARAERGRLVVLHVIPPLEVVG